MAFFASCDNNNQKENKKMDAVAKTAEPTKNFTPGNFSAQTSLHFRTDEINNFLKKYPLLKPLEKDIRKFYSSRNDDYAWFDNNGLIEQSSDLYNHAMNIEMEGLPNKTLYKDSLDLLFNQSSSENRENTETELMLTAQYFGYINQVYGGLSESSTKKLDWFVPRKKIDLPFMIDSLLRDTSSNLIADDYNYRQYALLKQYLKKYKQLDSSGKWNVKIEARKSYKPGDSSSSILTIRKKLFLSGDIEDDNESNFFDKELEEAVQKFQQRCGEKEDGIVGTMMQNKLNTPISSIIQQIIVNMERCRWVPSSLNDNYLVVNIPAFQLYVYEKDSVLFNMKVVVGKAMHKTAIFSGDLKYVVFSPYWNVPPDIMKNEVLPAIRRDPNYLQRNNMEWNGKSIRQKPGPKNSLGLVKFLFPNSYHIYLHDSPAKSLFDEHSRAFSHGCIRVAEPKKLAMYLLRNDSSWTENKVAAAMKSGKEKYVTLKKTVPVFIAYFTTWVDRNGKLNIRDDIYNRDDRLASMLFNKAKKQ